MSKYNPKIHNRKSLRLKGYDYSQARLYFITICCQHRICRFGRVENAKMVLNEYGQIAHNEWLKLTDRFPNFELDVFQIMPNHMHGIISLKNIHAGAELTPAPDNNEGKRKWGQSLAVAPTVFDQNNQTKGIAPTISDIVGAYKSLVANGCLKLFKMKNQTMGKLWQRNYYEIIIRNQQAYHNISEYIKNNPAKWMADKFYK